MSMAEEPAGRQGVLREVFGRQEAAKEAQNGNISCGLILETKNRLSGTKFFVAVVGQK